MRVHDAASRAGTVTVRADSPAPLGRIRQQTDLSRGYLVTVYRTWVAYGEL
ncbi:MAG: hypothetical protein JWR85_3210 [Marmoricola sp.]|nr:hypothetical protein [Marmoricola sp.]